MFRKKCKRNTAVDVNRSLKNRQTIIYHAFVYEAARPLFDFPHWGSDI